YPKKKHEAMDEVIKILKVIKGTKQKYKSKEIVNTLVGKVNALIKSHKTDERPFFGIGKDHEPPYWMALIRQVLVQGYIRKEIEQYGVLHLNEKGIEFLNHPESFKMTEDHSYTDENVDTIVTASKGGGAVADPKLLALLKDLRKQQAKKLEVPPFVIFQDPSLEDMALKYPVDVEELLNIHGVGEGKAKKYG